MNSIPIAKTVPIRDAGFDELWLQDQIVANPSALRFDVRYQVRYIAPIPNRGLAAKIYFTSKALGCSMRADRRFRSKFQQNTACTVSAWVVQP